MGPKKHLAIFATKNLTSQCLFTANTVSKPDGWNAIININGLQSPEEISAIVVQLNSCLPLLSPDLKINFYGNGVWGRHEMLHFNVIDALKTKKTYDYYHVNCENSIPIKIHSHFDQFKDNNIFPPIDQQSSELIRDVLNDDRKNPEDLESIEILDRLNSDLFRDINLNLFLKGLYGVEINYSNLPCEIQSYTRSDEKIVLPSNEAYISANFLSVYTQFTKHTDPKLTISRIPSVSDSIYLNQLNGLPFCIYQHTPFTTFTNEYVRALTHNNVLSQLRQSIANIFAPEMKFGALAAKFLEMNNIQGTYSCLNYHTGVRLAFSIDDEPTRQLTDIDLDLINTEKFSQSPWRFAMFARKASIGDIYFKFLSIFRGISIESVKGSYSQLSKRFDHFSNDSNGTYYIKLLHEFIYETFLKSKTGVIRDAIRSHHVELSFDQLCVKNNNDVIANFDFTGYAIQLKSVNQNPSNPVNAISDRQIIFDSVFDNANNLILVPKVFIGNMLEGSLTQSDLSIVEIHQSPNRVDIDDQKSLEMAGFLMNNNVKYAIDCFYPFIIYGLSLDRKRSLAYTPAKIQRFDESRIILFYTGLSTASSLILELELNNSLKEGYAFIKNDLRNYSFEKIMRFNSALST